MAVAHMFTAAYEIPGLTQGNSPLPPGITAPHPAPWTSLHRPQGTAEGGGRREEGIRQAVRVCDGEAAAVYPTVI